MILNVPWNILRILLDSSFLRHLELVQQIPTISQFSKQKNWEFIIPEIVLNELNINGLSEPLQNLLNDNTINSHQCNENQFSLLQNQLMGLGGGELEAICIVSLCEDQTFKIYLILTDDNAAQRKAGDLGMNSLEIVTFLFTANKEGFLTKNAVLDSLNILSAENYHIPTDLRRDIENRLVDT